MKRSLFTQTIKQSLLAVPAAALMLGAAHAGTTVGLNIAGGSYANYAYYGTAIYASCFTGFPVTATAFGVAPSDWICTGSTDGVSPLSGSYTGPYPYTGPASGSTNAGPGGAVSISWSGANTWGTQIGLDSGTGSGATFAPTPGNDEVTWGMLDNTGWSINVSGLNAAFPNGYVVQGIAAGKVNESSRLTVTDGSSFTDSLAADPIYQAATSPSGPIGLMTAQAHAADAITLSNPSRPDATAFALSGFIITDKPVVSYGPPSGSFASGSTISLSAAVAALTNSLHYQWRSNGVPILNATNATYTKAGATTADSANYDFVVTNLYGSATSGVATVTVAAPVPVTWDANTGTSGAQDGSGTWDATTANWWNGTSDVAWSSLNPAIFGAGGTGTYTVTLTNSVSSSGGITFNSGTYTITNSGGASLTLAGSGSLTANTNAIITVPLAGTVGMIKAGNGTLTLANYETYTGNTVVNGGTLKLSAGGPSGTLQGALTVNSNATVVCTVNNALGYSGANWVRNITLDHGTLNTSIANTDNGWGTTINMIGGTLGSTVAGGYFAMGNGPVFNVTGTNIPSVISADITVRDGTAGIVFNVTRGSAAVDLSISGSLRSSSSGGITLNGGITQLSGPNNNYTGDTVVNSGTLVVSSIRGTGTGAVTLGDNVGLVAYANGSSITITNGGTLSIGTGNGTNTLGFGSLTSTNVAPITVNYLAGNNPITVNIISLAPAVGQYPLIKSLSGASINSLTLGPLPSGFTATLVDDTAGASQSVYLNVTAAPQPPILTWTGASGVWDINTTANWTINNGVTTLNYQDPDYTVFNDSATATAITLNTAVSPAGVTFSNVSKNYTLSGSGSISGFTGLTKTGNGTLTLSNTNTFTGETVVGGGTLFLNDGLLATSDITNSSAVIYNNSTAQTVSYPITGTGTVTKNGSGTLTMSVDSPVSGGFTVNAGTLRVTAGNFAGQFTHSPITINTNGTILNDTFHALGGGVPSLVINHGTWLLNYEDYKQSITMMDGLIASGGGGNGGDLRIGYGGGGGTYTLRVTNSIAGSVISERVNTITSSLFWVLDAARGAALSDLTVSGVIMNSGNITKTGNGIVTFTATNTYTGNTAVNAGTLALAGNAALASPSILIGGGATFDVSGLTSSPMVLASGQTLGNSSSTAQVKGSVDASSGSLALTYAGTPALAVGNGTLTLGAGTPLDINNTGSPLANGNFKLIAKNAGGAVAGTLPSSFTVSGNGLASGATATLTNSNNELYLAVIGGVNTNPTNITFTVSGSTLTLSWPSDHLGWSLQAQTNALNIGLATNWVTIPGSDSVTSTNMTIDPTKPTVFYRLVYP